MAEGSRVNIAVKEETVWGVLATGQYKSVNFTSESLMLDKSKERSKRVLPTREYASVLSKTQNTTGTIETILQAGNVEELFKSSLMSDWSDVTGGSGGGVITAGLTSSNLDIKFTAEPIAGQGGTIEFGSAVNISILKDQVIFVTDSPNDGENDGAYIVKNVAGKVVTVNAPLVTATYQSGTKVQGDVIRNGSTITSFSIEREHQDVSKFFQYSGMICSSTNIKIEPENEATVNFTFVGKDEATDNVTKSSPAASASSTTPEFIVGKNVDGVFINYDKQDDCLVGSFDLVIDNQAEGRKSVAVFGACAPRIKTIDVNGNIMLWFADFDNYAKYVDDTPFSFTYVIGDSLGNKFAITLAKAEYSSGSVNTSNTEDEVPEEHEFLCSTNGVFTIQICKLNA